MQNLQLHYNLVMKNQQQDSRVSKLQNQRYVYPRDSKHTQHKAKQKQREKQGQSYHSNEDEEQKMINDSMLQLQDPRYLEGEMDEFENRLKKTPTNRGFCKITRDQSKLLCNAEGYRKFKKQLQLSAIKGKERQKNQSQLISNDTNNSVISQKNPINNTAVKKRQSEISLTYSNESQTNFHKEVQNPCEQKISKKITNKNTLFSQLQEQQQQQGQS